MVVVGEGDSVSWKGGITFFNELLVLRSESLMPGSTCLPNPKLRFKLFYLCTLRALWNCPVFTGSINSVFLTIPKAAVGGLVKDFEEKYSFCASVSFFILREAPFSSWTWLARAFELKRTLCWLTSAIRFGGMRTWPPSWLRMKVSISNMFLNYFSNTR